MYLYRKVSKLCSDIYTPVLLKASDSFSDVLSLPPVMGARARAVDFIFCL